MVDGSDFDVSADLDFCNTHSRPFQTGATTRSKSHLILFTAMFVVN